MKRSAFVWFLIFGLFVSARSSLGVADQNGGDVAGVFDGVPWEMGSASVTRGLAIIQGQTQEILHIDINSNSVPCSERTDPRVSLFIPEGPKTTLITGHVGPSIYTGFLEWHPPSMPVGITRLSPGEGQIWIDKISDQTVTGRIELKSIKKEPNSYVEGTFEATLCPH
jgi:hypothetical protein